MSQGEFALYSNIGGGLHKFLQVVLFLVIWDIFFSPKRERKALLLAGSFAAVNVLLYFCPIVTAGGRYVICAVLVLGYCRIRYRGSIEKAVFILLLFFNFHGMSFLIASSFYQVLADEMLGRLDMQDAGYMAQMYRMQIAGQGFNLLIYMIAFIIMTWILKKIVNSPLSMNLQDVVFLSALNVVGSMMTWIVIDLSAVPMEQEIFFLYTRKREMVWKIPMLAVLLFAGEISAIIIFQRYKELQDEKEKHFVEEQQMKAMKRRLEEAEHFYGSIRRARHEMKGHMANIKGLVAGEQYGEVETYIQKMDETIQELDYKFSTGNAVTDVIINDKYRRAKKAGIVFTVKFEYRESDTVSAFDMGIVLNNLLDNAIEASEKVDREKRRISLALKRKEYFLLVEVENCFDGRPIWKDGEEIPETTKQSSLPEILMEHGVGLKNVQDVAERYLGYMDIKAEGDVFKVTVMLQQRNRQHKEGGER